MVHSPKTKTTVFAQQTHSLRGSHFFAPLRSAHPLKYKYVPTPKHLVKYKMKSSTLPIGSKSAR
jgi:hypothetical protein